MTYSPSPRVSRLILLSVVLGISVLVASTWRYFGQTWDEPEHLAAGLTLLEDQHYVYDIQHPPLARLAIAAGPYLAGARSVHLPPPDGGPEGREILYREGHYDLFLVLARLGALPFLGLALLATWCWARTARGPESEPTDLRALLAVGLVAATPTLLGHAGLATNDVAAAGTCLLALWGLLRWVERPALGSTVIFGVTLAVATATKLSALPFVGLVGVAFLALRHWTRRSPDGPPAPRSAWSWLGDMALVALIVSIVLTVVYGGRFVYLTDPQFGYAHSIDFVFGRHGVLRDLVRTAAAHVPVPEALPLLLGGIEALEVHNKMGHVSFLLGEVRSTGWWYFYIVALAAKLPLPILGLGLAGLANLAVDGWRRRNLRELATPVVFCTVLAFCSAFSHINLGVRHVLVLVPLLAVGAASMVLRIWTWSASATPVSRTALRLATVMLLLWQGSTLPRAYPDYLAYFNEAVPHPEEVLVDSDLDWGQDLRRLEQRAHALSLPRLGLAYLGSADPAREPLPPFVPLRPGQRATGWVAINELARIHGGRGYSWLDAYTPRERIGKTIDLYYITPPTAARSTR